MQPFIFVSNLLVVPHRGAKNVDRQIHSADTNGRTSRVATPIRTTIAVFVSHATDGLIMRDAVRALSLCSGVGGLDLALRLVYGSEGCQTLAYCEIDPFCQDALLRRAEDGWLDRAPIWPDLRTLSHRLYVDMYVNPCHYLDEEEGMGAPRKDYDHAVVLYEQGLSIGEVAAFYGITRQAMHTILKRRGVICREQLRFGKDNHFHRGGKTVKARANDILERALLKGVLVRRDSCEQCDVSGGRTKGGHSTIQAHHDDYNQPLSVRWLCPRCHHEWHKSHRPKAYKEPREAARIDIVTAGFP